MVQIKVKLIKKLPYEQKIIDLFGFAFADPPDPPGKPVVEDVDADSVTLSWSKPLSDGGNKINGYVVEAREKGTDKWKPLNDRHPCRDTTFTGTVLPTIHVVALSLFILYIFICHIQLFVKILILMSYVVFYVADDLKKNTEYEFRVKARNKAGLGDPSRSTGPVETKPKCSKFIFLKWRMLK